LLVLCSWVLDTPTYPPISRQHRSLRTEISNQWINRVNTIRGPKHPWAKIVFVCFLLAIVINFSFCVSFFSKDIIMRLCSSKSVVDNFVKFWFVVVLSCQVVEAKNTLTAVSGVVGGGNYSYYLLKFEVFCYLKFYLTNWLFRANNFLIQNFSTGLL